MAKQVEKCCGTCTWAEWPKNALGHRLKKYAGKCLCPIPPLPASIRSQLHVSSIGREDGKTCEFWKDEKKTPQKFKMQDAKFISLDGNQFAVMTDNDTTIYLVKQPDECIVGQDAEDCLQVLQENLDLGPPG